MRKFLFVLFLLLVVFFAAPQKADACNNFFPGNAVVVSNGFSPAFVLTNSFFAPQPVFVARGNNVFFVPQRNFFVPQRAFFFSNNRRAVFFFR